MHLDNVLVSTIFLSLLLYCFLDLYLFFNLRSLSFRIFFYYYFRQVVCPLHFRVYFSIISSSSLFAFFIFIFYTIVVIRFCSLWFASFVIK
jgi:hypothetical protein